MDASCVKSSTNDAADTQGISHIAQRAPDLMEDASIQLPGS